MEREKASALPSPASKAAKTYFANLCSLLGHAINLELPKPEFQVYIPRPASISSFNDSTLESVLDLLRFPEDDLEGYEHRYGGKLLTFTSEVAATNVAKQFPVDVVVGKKTHCFHTAPPGHLFRSPSSSDGTATPILQRQPALVRAESGSCTDSPDPL